MTETSSPETKTASPAPAPALPPGIAGSDPQGAGTLDLEKGMHAAHVSNFATILSIVLVMLAVFNSEGLLRWTQRLPSSPINSLIAERAADWDRLMQLRKTLAGQSE